ncbi:glycosyltransferase family 2 protein [Escherichia coli]|nr:glycosyltransferase family 2 protein [Escherichia coli]
MIKNHVSFFIVSYNHKNFIDCCIKSVIAQLSASYDLTVIDNCSVDGTVDELKRLNKIYKFSLIMNDQNYGLPSTLNKALSLASGEYICFLAADDYMMFDRLTTQISFLNQNQQYYACAGTQLKVDDSNVLCDLSKQKNIISSFTVIDKNNIFKSTNIIYSPTSIYRTEVLKKIGGYKEGILIEDLYIYYKAASLGYKMALLPNLFCFYRIHKGNSHTKLKWMFENKLKILAEFSEQSFYRDLSDLIHLEGFYSLSQQHKKDAIKILPRVLHRLDSKYLYAGLFNLLLKW